MSHDPFTPCEMFCQKPVGPNGDPGSEDWKACCPECRSALKFVTHEVMPAIRKQGYYSPPGSTPDDEFADMQKQGDFRATAADLLADLLGEGAAGALGWGPRDGAA